MAHRMALVGLSAIVCSAFVIVDLASAQCGGGRSTGGGSTLQLGGSTGSSLAGLAYPTASLSMPSGYPALNPLLVYQQQQLMIQGAIQKQLAYQQEQKALRVAREEVNRAAAVRLREEKEARRLERIAQREREKYRLASNR